MCKIRTKTEKPILDDASIFSFFAVCLVFYCIDWSLVYDWIMCDAILFTCFSVWYIVNVWSWLSFLIIGNSVRTRALLIVPMQFTTCINCKQIASRDVQYWSRVQRFNFDAFFPRFFPLNWSYGYYEWYATQEDWQGSVHMIMHNLSS